MPPVVRSARERITHRVLEADDVSVATGEAMFDEKPSLQSSLQRWRRRPIAMPWPCRPSEELAGAPRLWCKRRSLRGVGYLVEYLSMHLVGTKKRTCHIHVSQRSDK